MSPHFLQPSNSGLNVNLLDLFLYYFVCQDGSHSIFFHQIESLQILLSYRHFFTFASVFYFFMLLAVRIFCRKLSYLRFSINSTVKLHKYFGTWHVLAWCFQHEIEPYRQRHCRNWSYLRRFHASGDCNDSRIVVALGLLVWTDCRNCGPYADTSRCNLDANYLFFTFFPQPDDAAIRSSVFLSAFFH